MTTPEVITELLSNEIFVFGSNREGRHGKGAALVARQRFGAIYGRAEGPQGQSYAIITKELRRDWPAVSLSEVKKGVYRFKAFALARCDLRFLVTPIGCNLAGFQPSEIGHLFVGSTGNIILPACFLR